MDAIVAVYSDWGIGANGTQPITISADRKHFRDLTENAAVIVGRKTLNDFPGGKPLKNRTNIVLSRTTPEIQGAIVVSTPEDAFAAASKFSKCYVIGGAGVYNALFPYIDRVYVTEISACPASDSFFPNLQTMTDWEKTYNGPWALENDYRYRFCTFERQ